MLDYSASGWIPPWRTGLAQRACVSCGRVVVEITMTRLHCVPCTRKHGVKPEEIVEEQLEIPLF